MSLLCSCCVSLLCRLRVNVTAGNCGIEMRPRAVYEIGTVEARGLHWEGCRDEQQVEGWEGSNLLQNEREEGMLLRKTYSMRWEISNGWCGRGRGGGGAGAKKEVMKTIFRSAASLML